MAVRILVMNDDQALLDLYGLLLESEGYEAHLSKIILEDVHQIEELNPACIILDCKFGPETTLTGLELLQKIRLYRPTAHIPVILCTAAVSIMRNQEDILRQKDVPLIYKPFDIDELLAAIEQRLSNAASLLPSTN